MKVTPFVIAFLLASLTPAGLSVSYLSSASALPPLSQGEKHSARVDALGDALPDAALLRLGTRRFRHPNSAAGLVLSPDEKTVITLGSGGLYAWDTATGKERWHAGRDELQRDLNSFVGASRLVLSPDGASCITLGRGLSFKTWDVKTGQATTIELVGDILGKPTELSSLDVSPDGKVLALGGERGIFLCERAGKILARIASKPPKGLPDPNKDRLLSWRPFSYGRFSPDGRTLAVVTSEAPDVIKQRE